MESEVESRKKLNVLFITRNFPPQVGGLERVAFYLYSYLKKKTNVFLLKWSGSKKFLVFILPYFFVKASFILIFGKVDLIYFNEGFLTFLGILLRVFRKPAVVTIHGLDITYKSKIYQLIIPRCISKMEKVICISEATKLECIKRGVPQNKIYVIPDGIEDEFYLENNKEVLKKKIFEKFKINIGEKKVLLSVCRLIERKGIHWFIEKVVPQILKERNDFIYIVVGEGRMKGIIRKIIKEKELGNWVFLPGKVNNEDLKLFYNISDIFIMPNIPVKGDFEGFGIVALEAASCKVPVLASDLEGIREAVKHGKNGFLIPPRNVKFYLEKIKYLLEDDDRKFREEIRIFVKSNYSWEKITGLYLDVFKNLVKKNSF